MDYKIQDILIKAKEIGKEDSTVCYLLGKSLAQIGDTDKAIEFLKKAIKLNRNNLVARFELAKVYINRNEHEFAQEHIQFLLDHPLESPVKKQIKALATSAVSS